MLDNLVLITCISVGIASVFYIFYWNRLVAALLGLVIRFFCWSQGASSIWVHIGSIQLSLLSGRIFLKDLRYHSSNQTIRIVKVQIIWKYWLRRPLSDDNIGSMFGAEDGTSSRTPSCRIQISLQGFEWFLYNRTAAFDNILSQMASQDTAHQPASKCRRSMDTHQSIHAYTPAEFGTPLEPSYVLGALRLKTPTALQDLFSWLRRQLPNLDPKELLPMGIDITKGVILCGNNSTPNLMVAEFENGKGTFGITQSRSKFDLYKQILTLAFRNVLVQYVDNKQYGDTMPVIGEMIRDQAELSDNLTPIASYTNYQRFGKLWRKLGLYSFFGKYVNRQGAPKHHGRSFMRKPKKSLDEGTPIGADFTNVEYAIERKILSTPSLELCYYADAAGEVPPLHLHTKQAGVDAIGNGDAGPEWGVDMIIRGGYIRYGPWADRQRGELQRAFFPPNYNDVEETPRLQPGDERLWTDLRVFIELRDDTTLHIPFREASKNWQWDGLTEFPRPKTREHAVIRLVAGDQSSVCYTMPMIAGPKGYEPTLEVHLDTVAVTSSLNDIRLISAESCRVRCDLPSPLKWNASRTWDIAVSIRQPILYLLRDHVNMFADLGKDWASGPPNDFFRFIPTIYNFQLDLHRFEMNLYVNDHNIIDKPLVRSDNAFAILRGVVLHHSLTIPSNIFRATETTIPFIIDVPDVSISLSLPKWHTHALHSPAKGIHIGTLNLHLDGSYRYFSSVQDDNVEQLKLSFVLKDVAFKAMGWSIRYFMILRENYFGSFTHFSTLYEYLERRSRGLPPGDPDLDKYRPGTSNMMQIVLVVCLEHGCIILPAGLPGYDKPHVADENGDSVIGHCLTLDLPELQVYLRLHDFFMDFAFNVGTISARVLEQCPEVVTYSLNQASEKALVLIDGIDITANRLFGPLPRTVTYFCAWEIQLGCIRGSLSASNAFIISSAISAFRLNFTDAPNAPAAEYMPALYPDITFVKVSLEGLDIVWKTEDSAIHVSLPSGLRMDNNNLGGKFHRTLTSIRIPTVSIKVLSNVTSHHNNWLESASISTDVSVDIYTSPAGWRTLAEDQLNFVDEQDALTGRAAAMFQALWGDQIGEKPYAMHRNGVHIPQPLPSHSSRFTARGRHRGHEQGKWQSPPLSESEDDRLPEAERDARLAKTRSEFVSPVREVVDDGDMSGADESDDDDVSDGASYSSDWSDSEKAQVSSDHWHYSRFARHYGGRSVDSPSLWDQGPFFLTKDYKIESSLPSETFPQLPGSYCTLPENDIEVTVFRIYCRNDIDVRITPLTIPAISHFLNDLEKIPLAPELSIDGMVASYLSSLPNPQKSTKARNIIDVDISSAHLHLVRRLDHVKTESTGMANVRVLGLHVSGSFQSRAHSFAANCQEIGLQFSVIRDTQRMKDVLFSLELQGLVVSSQHRSLAISYDSLSINVRHTLPEHAVALSLGIVQDVKDLHPIFKRRQQFLLENRIRVVRGILSTFSEETIVDPLSAVQPSYLIQSGVPHQLRTDPFFRFLFHIRDCLWDIENGNGIVNTDTEDLDLESLIPLLEDRLLALDPDAYHLSRLTILEPLFPELRQITDIPEPPKLGYPFACISLHMKRTLLSVIDPSPGPPSCIELEDLEFSGRIRFLDFIHDQSSSQLSVGQESPLEIVQTYTATLVLESAKVVVYPHLMGFAQHLLRAQNIPTTPKVQKVSQTKPQARGLIPITNLEVVTQLKTLRVQAIAANLILEFGMDATQTGSMIMFRHGRETNMNHSLMFAVIFIRAQSPSDVQQSDDILASLALTCGRIHNLTHQDPLSGLKVRLAFDLKAFNFSVPRSALRLYRFYQDWRNDFIPGVESAMRELVVELKQTPDPSTRAKQTSRSPRSLQINGHVHSFAILLQVMHGTWISWELRGSTVHFNSTSSPRRTQQAFGIQVASQTFSVSPKADDKNVTPNSRVKLDLPSLSVSGRLDGQCIKAVALVEFLDLKVKPSHWDTLMAVQQKFGHDFNDFLSLIQETRNKQTTLSTNVPKDKPATKVIISMKIRGFRIGLEGLSSTVYLECLDISGGLDTTSERTWFVTLSDLALSLASRTSVEAQAAAFSRSRRSAFVILDFKASSKGARKGAEFQEDTLRIRITKIHAVMQPSSMGQVGDFIDDMQTEMLIRQEQRAHELAAFKQKTQQLFESFEVKGPTTDVPETSAASLLDSYSIDLSISNVGVAFPLIHDDQLNLPQHGSHDGNSVRAFLFSIASIQFGTVRGVTGEASMKRFSFQFVHRFRQSVAADFSGETHQTRNRLVYPEMTAFLTSTRSPTSRQISMKANVSGFILDLDSTIPDYVFSLIDVYRQGKERMAQLSQPKVPTPFERHEEPEKDAPSRPKGPIPTTTFCGSLDFLSGKVRTYGASASQLSRVKGFDRTDEEVLDVGGEVFNLPGVSVWMEYRATPASHKFDDDNEEESSLLMFKSTVHSSQNTLRPTLLPFFTEMVSRIEHRMRQSSPNAAESPVVPSLDLVEEKPASPRETSSMQISFSLRIDQSKLELTCKPDVNVVAALHWDSGGFVVNVSPGARNVTFTGSVGGLTIGLRHGFLSEDCVSLDARNLAFSVGFSKLDVEHGRSISTVSLILDTEFLGGIRFSRLQDVLCFKAVWLDKIPMFNGRSPAPDIKAPSKAVTPDASMILSPPPQQEFSTVLLIRIRQIKLDIDLGQSISTIVLDLRDSVLRTKLTESINEVSLSVGDVSMTARGNIGGKVHVGDCVFQTIRRIEQSHEEVGSQSRMLELRMTSGPFIVALESEHQKLLHYRAEPLAVEIFDDWSQVVAHPHASNRPLRLSFTIVGPEIVAAATIGTIPQILSYVNKFKANLDMQRDGASRDSKTFRATRAPQPDNALSAVAEAMIHSARSRIKEVVETGLSYIIRQHMSLHLDLLRLVVFPRSMDDVEAAQFVGRNVRARLDRLIQSGEPSKRDLSLSFTGMTISRLSQLGHTVSALQFSENNDWLNVLMRGASEATIVGLPSMKMHMVSEESQKDGNTVLQYDFESSFLRLQGKQEYEDIYIALNVGLYSWLAVLRKTLTREMEQVKAASEWMNTLSAPTNISSLRRKGPDVINTFEVPKSAPATRSSLPVPPTSSARSASSATSTFSLPPLGEGTLLSVPTERFGEDSGAAPSSTRPGLIYLPRQRHIERLNMRQLGEATPNVMHPFFMKKAGFSLEDSLPQYVNEYATTPLEEIMEVLLKLYSRQLLDGRTSI